MLISFGLIMFVFHYSYAFSLKFNSFQIPVHRQNNIIVFHQLKVQVTRNFVPFFLCLCRHCISLSLPCCMFCVFITFELDWLWCSIGRDIQPSLFDSIFHCSRVCLYVCCVILFNFWCCFAAKNLLHSSWLWWWWRARFFRCCCETILMMMIKSSSCTVHDDNEFEHPLLFDWWKHKVPIGLMFRLSLLNE